jgi:hypothetical protein
MLISSSVISPIAKLYGTARAGKRSGELPGEKFSVFRNPGFMRCF